MVEEESCDLPLWIVFVDGSSNNSRSGAGIILVTPDQIQLNLATHFGFRASNNKSEYEVLLVGLRMAMAVGAENLHICSDSQLVVNQVKGAYTAKRA